MERAMEQKKRMLDQYAEEYHEGNVKKAIWDLVHNADKDTFRKYTVEMTEEEAGFTLDLVELRTIKNVGDEEMYKLAYKAEELSQQINISVDDIQLDSPNPFKKKLLFSVFLIVAAVILPVALMLILKKQGVPAGWLGAVSACAIGLSSMKLATELLNSCKFRKLKKLVAIIPSREEALARQKESPYLFFEECMEYHQYGLSALNPASLDEVECAFADATQKQKKATIAFLLLQIASIVAVCITVIIGMVGGTIVSAPFGFACAGGIIAVTVWQLFSVGKATRKTKTVFDRFSRTDLNYKTLQTRQNWTALLFILICLAYFVADIIGCIFCIMLGLNAG